MAQGASALSRSERRALIAESTDLIYEEVFDPAYPLSELRQAWHDNTLDTGLWVNNYGTATTVSGERLRIPVTTTYSGINTEYKYAFDSVYCQAFPAAQASATTECYSAMWVRSQSQPAGTMIGFFYDAILNRLWFANQVAYYDSAEVYATYDSTAMRWWRVRLVGGSVLWDTSPDGITWTNRRTLADAATWTGEPVTLFLEGHRNNGTDNLFEIDNLNIVVTDLSLTAGAMPVPLGAPKSDTTIEVASSYGPEEYLFNPAAVDGDRDYPAGFQYVENAGLNLGNTFDVNVPGRVTKGRFRFPTTPSGTYWFNLYQVTGADTTTPGGTSLLAAPVQFSSVPAGVWGEVTLPTPVDLTPGTLYRAVVWSSQGIYTAKGLFYTTEFVSSTGRMRGIVHNAAYFDGAIWNGTYRGDTVVAYTTSSFNATCYFVDVAFTPEIEGGGGTNVDLTAGALPLALGAGSAALALNRATQGYTAPVMLGPAKAALGISANTDAKPQSAPVGIVTASGAVALATTASAAPTAASAGGAGLRADGITLATTLPLQVGTGNGALAVNRATTAYSSPVPVGFSSANAVMNLATAAQTVPVMLGAGRGAVAVDMATALKTAGITFGTPNLFSAISRADVFKSASVYLSVGGTLLETTNAVILTGGALPILMGAGSASLVIQQFTGAKAQPAPLGTPPATAAVSIATAATTQPVILGTSRSGLATDWRTTASGLAVPVGVSRAGLAVDRATLAKPQPTPLGITSAAEVINLITSGKAVPVLAGIGGLTTSIYGPILEGSVTLWDGTVETPLILVGLWDGTQIVPVELESF